MTLDRARESLQAAELCLREGLVNSATSRGYYAMLGPTCSEQEEDRIELALAARAGEIFEATGLFIVCGVVDRPAH